MMNETTPEQTNWNIGTWSEKIIQGPGGMNDYEAHEIVVWAYPERVEAALWTLHCLANPQCEGSAEMISAILGRREEQSFAMTEGEPPRVDYAKKPGPG